MKTPSLSDNVGEWMRLPRPGCACSVTGLSRSALWAFVQNHGVRSVALRKPGAAKGARLIHRASLLYKLDELAELESANRSSSLAQAGTAPAL